MKKIKLLVASLLLFLAAGSISAQNDSIYGLEASNEDNIMNLSFYSTYETNDLEYIVIRFYDSSNTELGNGVWIQRVYGGFPSKFGTVSLENISENITKINISNAELFTYLQNTLKIELYIMGEGYVPSNILPHQIGTASVGQSNVLTFYFNSIPTSINKTINTENHTYKYFLLSGIESTTKPLGVPFIEMIYDNGVLIGKNKYLIGK